MSHSPLQLYLSFYLEHSKNTHSFLAFILFDTFYKRSLKKVLFFVVVAKPS